MLVGDSIEFAERRTPASMSPCAPCLKASTPSS